MLPFKLNPKGKITAASVLILFLIIIIGVFGGNESTVKKSEATSVETIPDSFEKMDSFADSALNETIVYEQQTAEEEADQEKFQEQHQQDLKDKVIYLTFDDGPSENADELLDILDSYGMKATFFMLGPNMEDHPDVVKRMKNDQHGLALHSMTHEVNEVYQDASSPLEEMTEAQQILEDITGFSSHMIRLPYGSVPYLTEEMRYLLNQEDFHIWDWNVDSNDWDVTNGSYVPETKQKIKEAEEEGEAPIVLLHDKKETLEHLPELLTYIQQEGYQTKVLDNDMAPKTFPCEGRCYSIN